jgi:putative nucleotidyltransferase-like protein
MNIQTSSHRTELELLLLCARLTVDPRSEARLKVLARPDVDWEFFTVAANHHRVLPLVTRTLERVQPDGVPDATRQLLRNALYANARRNLRLTNELLQIIDLLRAEDISCIPYKGPVLAAQIYGDISLRQFADLDIIVPAKDVTKAKTSLTERGYRYTKQTEKDISLRRDAPEIDVELHWGVTTDIDPIQIPPQLLWTDLRPFPVAGRSVLTHSYENLLLVQCLHGAKHGWEKIGWLCDIAEIVRTQSEVNWDQVIERATSIGGRKALFLGLALVQELLGASPPATVVQTMLKEPPLTSLCDQVKHWFFSERPIPRGEHEHFFVRLQEHPADRIRVACKHAKRFLALNARDTGSFRVPGGLSWTLYPLRIIRLVHQYGVTPFTRFLGGIFQS